MNREIKFRAWGKSKRAMYYQDFAVNPDGTTKTWGLYEHLELMQYTGLEDKNGKEIYEGDIVTAGDNYPSIIEWSHDGDKIEGTGWCLHEVYKGDYDRYHTTDAYTNGLGEVIGNIYENPELLK